MGLNGLPAINREFNPEPGILQKNEHIIIKTLCIFLNAFIYIYISISLSLSFSISDIYIYHISNYTLCGWSCGCMQVDAYIQWWGSSKLVNG